MCKLKNLQNVRFSVVSIVVVIITLFCVQSVSRELNVASHEMATTTAVAACGAVVMCDK